MKDKRPTHRTQWAAQFAVASELCKLGYEVALTLGNQPAVDLVVISPKKKTFQIEVKGLYTENYWQLKKQKLRKELYYVFAYVPDNGSNRFFIIDQRSVNRLLDQHRAKFPAKLAKKYRWGIPWPRVEKYVDNWRALPDYRPLPRSK